MNAHLIALATVLVWGVTFVSTKVLLVDFAPIEILFIRFLMGFAALWLLRRHVLRTKKRSHELLFAAAGITGVTLYYLLENVALVYANASVVGVVVAVSPLFTAILGTLTGSERKLGVRFFAGFVVAMAGIALVSLQGAVTVGPDGTPMLAVSFGRGATCSRCWLRWCGRSTPRSSSASLTSATRRSLRRSAPSRGVCCS